MIQLVLRAQTTDTDLSLRNAPKPPQKRTLWTMMCVYVGCMCSIGDGRGEVRSGQERSPARSDGVRNQQFNCTVQFTFCQLPGRPRQQLNQSFTNRNSGKWDCRRRRRARTERRTRNPITEPPFPIRTIVVPGAGEQRRLFVRDAGLISGWTASTPQLAVLFVLQK